MERSASGGTSRLPCLRDIFPAVATVSLLMLSVLSLLIPIARAAPVYRRPVPKHHHVNRRHGRAALCRRHGSPSRRRRVIHHRRRPVPACLRPLVTPPARLVFGIYPGGAAGTVGPSGAIKPEDSAKRLAALDWLRSPGHPFVLHLYAAYTAPDGWSAADQLGSEISQYTGAGFQVEPVLTYRPADGGSAADVAAFTEFARAAVDALGSNPGVVALQVTNEANIDGAPNASDGYYTGASDALIQGIIAAKAEARSRGFGQIRVGFNWAYDDGSSENSFWRHLGTGGSSFTSSLDWVGLDAYPGTWGPGIGSDLAGGTAAAMVNALAILRERYLPLAGIPPRVTLHVSENGYPTGPGRTEAMQATAMRAAVSTVSAVRGIYNVSDYRWFDLRDNDSASTSFEDRYGLMNDDYTPKAAFAVYRDLVASLA